MIRSRVRVRAGWVAGLIVLAVSHPTALSLAWGVPLAALGEAIRLWASGHIEKTARLATGGPYAHTRNPLYVGSVLLALGLGVASASVWVCVAVAAYFLWFYPSVIREEAQFLAQKFAADYTAWAAEVPVFAPRLTPGGPRESRFSWERVRVNREWRTAIALPVVVALLAARRMLLP